MRLAMPSLFVPALVWGLLLPWVPVAQAFPFDLPPIDSIVQYQPKQPLQVFTTDGIDIGQFGAERREYLPLARIPTGMQIHNIEMQPGGGGKLVRSAGVSATLTNALSLPA